MPAKGARRGSRIYSGVVEGGAGRISNRHRCGRQGSCGSRHRRARAAGLAHDNLTSTDALITATQFMDASDPFYTWISDLIDNGRLAIGVNTAAARSVEVTTHPGGVVA